LASGGGGGGHGGASLSQAEEPPAPGPSGPSVPSHLSPDLISGLGTWKPQPAPGKAPATPQAQPGRSPRLCAAPAAESPAPQGPAPSGRDEPPAHGPQPETLPHPMWRRGGLLEPALEWFLLQPPKCSLRLRSPREDRGGTRFPAAAGGVGGAHCPWAGSVCSPTSRGWAEDQGTGAERCWAGGRGQGLSRTKAVAGLLDLAGSVSKDSTIFFFKKAFIY